MTEPLRVMAIMPHQDDFEFNTGGAFAMLRRHYGDAVELRILCTTRGASGHQEMSLEETFRRREAEARASAALIGAEYECLTQLDGTHVPAQLFIDRNSLGGLWNTIRAFEPHAVFCPPVADDPLAGVHIDHLHTAEAVRLVAYQLLVPHAYPTMSGPVRQRVVQPVVINVHDPYLVTNRYDVALDVSDVLETKTEMALCHRSQIFEWLPFAGGQTPPDEAEYRRTFVERMHNRMASYQYQGDGVYEFFRFTRWGRKPKREDIARIFPTGHASDAFLASLD